MLIRHLLTLDALRLLQLFASFLIANFIAVAGVQAQNSVDNSTLTEKAERQRIAQERATQKVAYEQQRRDCYQKFAVTPCLNEARDANNDKLRDLKRQEVALDDRARKRTAAKRLQAIDERNSPQAQLKQAQSRGRALKKSAEREQAQLAKKQKHEEKLAAAASPASAASAPAAAQTAGAPAPTGKARVPTPEKLPPGQRPGDAEKIEQAKQQAALREKQALERRAKQQQAEAKRKKPPSAPLPVPQP
jgi:colicin import membrane protein